MRVSGGDDANTQSRPQPASLRRVRGNIGRHQCAGGLALDRTVAVQSANCIRPLTVKRVVRAAAVHEHGTPSPVSYIPSRQIVPTRHHHW